MDAKNVAQRTLNFLQTPSVVGFETPFINLLERYAKDLGRSTVRTNGLLAVEGGPLTVSAHADRHGLITYDGGRLIYAATELSDGPTTSGTVAAGVCERFETENVFAYDPLTGEVLGTGTVNHRDHCGQAAGTELGSAGLADLEAGVPVAFVSPRTWDGQWLRGQIDNTLSVALAMEMLHDGFDGTVLFTCGEEAGQSWKALAGWFEEPCDQLVVLDTSPFGEAGPADAGCVVLRRFDATGSFDETMSNRLASLAETAAVSTVWKDQLLASLGQDLGRTELGHLTTQTQGRVTGSTLQTPTTEYHTNTEATSIRAIEAVCKVLEQIG